MEPSEPSAASQEGQRSLFVEPDGREIRFADLAERYRKCLAPEWSTGHAENVAHALAVAVQAFEDPSVGQITAEKVALWRAEKIASGASKRTANAIVGAWRACLRWGCAMGILGRNPLEHLKPLRVTAADLRKVRRPISEDEAVRFFAASREADERRDYPQTPLWTWLSVVGTRWGETVALTWQDVDLATGAARIVPRNDKKRRGRWAVFDREIASMLVRLRARHAALKPGVENVFLSPTGRVYPKKASHALRTFKRELARARIELVTADGSIDVHALRGHATTALLAAGRPIASVCLSIGHADPKVTLRHYARMTAGALQASLFPRPNKKSGRKKKRY